MYRLHVARRRRSSLHCILTMKQYKFTVVVKSPMNIKDIVWAFTHKLKDAFPIVSITFDEVKDDKKDESPYNEIPERY